MGFMNFLKQAMGNQKEKISASLSSFAGRSTGKREEENEAEREKFRASNLVEVGIVIGLDTKDGKKLKSGHVSPGGVESADDITFVPAHICEGELEVEVFVRLFLCLALRYGAEFLAKLMGRL